MNKEYYKREDGTIFIPDTAELLENERIQFADLRPDKKDKKKHATLAIIWGDIMRKSSYVIRHSSKHTSDGIISESTIEKKTGQPGEAPYFFDPENRNLLKEVEKELHDVEKTLITTARAKALLEPVALPPVPAPGEGTGEPAEIATKAYQYLSQDEKDLLRKRFMAIGNKEERARECEKYCCKVSYSNFEKADLCGTTEPTYKRWKRLIKVK